MWLPYSHNEDCKWVDVLTSSSLWDLIKCVVLLMLGSDDYVAHFIAVPSQALQFANLLELWLVCSHDIKHADCQKWPVEPLIPWLSQHQAANGAINCY